MGVFENPAKDEAANERRGPRLEVADELVMVENVENGAREEDDLDRCLNPAFSTGALTKVNLLNKLPDLFPPPNPYV